MKSKRVNNTKDFERILKLIEEVRIRAFSKVNAELVLLYYNVGKTVSEKVSAGIQVGKKITTPTCFSTIEICRV